MKIGNRDFDTKEHTYVVGILNITPDSFSDGGKYNHVDAALTHVEHMIEEGMDILDIGGESTRPGFHKLSDEEEIQRVIPVINEVKKHFSIPVSLDTYKSKVAQAGIDAGIDVMNDIWGLKYDPEMAKMIAKAKITCILMHNRTENNYSNFLEDVWKDLHETLEIAKQAGIEEDKIILDPGIGFAKDTNQNLQMLNHLEEMQKFSCPVLLAASGKSVIGNTLKLPVEERLEGTLATTAWAVAKRCSFVRVHDIKENVRMIQMTEAMIKGSMS